MDSPVDSIRPNNSGNAQLAESSDPSIVRLARGMPRAKRMDPMMLSENPKIIERKAEDSSVTFLEVCTNKSKVLANAFRCIMRKYPDAPIASFCIGIIRSTGQLLMNQNVFDRLSKTHFFCFVPNNEPLLQAGKTIMIPFEAKTPGFKILCPSGILENNFALQFTFLNVKNIFQLIREHQNIFLSALKSDIIKIVEISVSDPHDPCLVQNSSTELIKKEVVYLIDIFSQRCVFIENCLSKITPTPLNSYLIYETILVEYLMVSKLFMHKFFGGNRHLFCSELNSTISMELSYILLILENINPYAMNAYEDLGYDVQDFNSSDAEIKEISNIFNGLARASFEESIRSIPTSSTKPSNAPQNKPTEEITRNITAQKNVNPPQPKKINQERTVQQNSPEPKNKIPQNPRPIRTPSSITSLLELTPDEIKFHKEQEQLRLQRKAEKVRRLAAQLNEPKPEDWNETKKSQELERTKRKATVAKKVVSEFKESAEAAEQKKLEERIASTTVFYDLPSREQFQWICEQLSNDHKKTFDDLYTAEAFSITPDKIHHLAERFAELLLAIGIDPLTAKAFLEEVYNRDHPNHPEKKLPEGYIKKRCTSFIIFSLYPMCWEPSSLDEYRALDTAQQRRIDWKLSQVSQL